MIKPPGKPGPSIFLPKQPKSTPMLPALAGTHLNAWREAWQGIPELDQTKQFCDFALLLPGWRLAHHASYLQLAPKRCSPWRRRSRPLCSAGSRPGGDSPSHRKQRCTAERDQPTNTHMHTRTHARNNMYMCLYMFTPHDKKTHHYKQAHK